MSSTHATMFGVITGVVGPALLLAVDNTAAALALANIVLYAGVYTPLKQMHPINTWVPVSHSSAYVHPFRVVVLTTSCVCACVCVCVCVRVCAWCRWGRWWAPFHR